ncbi:MAG TPA: tyrosine-protein phosphatase, partial [Candidatus Dormibacteraeota bacterium]|nr:tyrosine-protein phosphatase [Candidatus Dormibacteraeota bacterium]
LMDYGVTTVLDLRSDGEAARSPSPFQDSAAGVHYVRRVLIDDKNMNNIGDSNSMLERYLFIIEARPDAFRDVFQALAETDGTLLFHCFAGKDRTGLVAAMLLDLAGASADGIAADYAATDVQLARQYEIWIDEAPPEKRDAFREELRCPPERILGVLDHLHAKWGGVEGYLDACGVTAEHIDRLQSKLA